MKNIKQLLPLTLIAVLAGCTDEKEVKRLELAADTTMNSRPLVKDKPDRLTISLERAKLIKEHNDMNNEENTLIIAARDLDIEYLQGNITWEYHNSKINKLKAQEKKIKNAQAILRHKVDSLEKLITP